MDSDTARRVIREQDEAARERLRPVLIAQARRCDSVAKTIEPWLGRAWKRDWALGKTSDGLPVGRFRPDASRVIYDAHRWADRFDDPSWRDLHDAFCGFEYHYLSNVQINHTYSDLILVREPLLRHGVDRCVQDLYGNIKNLAATLREFAPNQLLYIPDEIHPPRHAMFRAGILARLFAEDLSDRIEECSEIEAAVAVAVPVSPVIREWSDRTSEFLNRHLGNDVGRGFDSVTKGADACDSFLIADANALGRAYVALGSAYLEEVQDRMSDYAEASGQAAPEPRVSMTFSGGNFYGGQFAAQIANIHSSLASVHQDGGAETADALRALGQAVMAQESLDDEQRRDLLDNVEYLADAAGKPPEKRNRGIIKSALGALSTAAAAGTELSTAMDAWGGVLHRLLP
ncbi:hypothetical protein ACQP25_17460 [Microtetraspora malaysiensis]|uniref:hypothetical protein n=1 Tax=Microtetraspora malaysiensis TaxID=161358 RepID=UPI003D8A17E6